MKRGSPQERGRKGVVPRLTRPVGDEKRGAPPRMEATLLNDDEKPPVHGGVQDVKHWQAGSFEARPHSEQGW